MTGYWKYIFGALALLLIATNAKDVVRYIKISSM
jgi:hypothetical protein